MTYDWRERLMLKYSDTYRTVTSRLLLALLVVSVLFLSTGCGLFGTKRKVTVPQLLTPLSEAGRDRLFQEVNRLSTVKSIHGKVDIQFEDTSFASTGVADRYRLVDGTLTLQRPGKIFLQIQFILVDIAQMASDGEQFRVAVLQGNDKYKRFVKGTNSAVYPKLPEEPTPTGTAKEKTEKETVSALSNLRPQHLTDAFMIRPIETNGSMIYAQSEFFQEEPDTRRQAKKDSRIMRGYYLLDEISQPSPGEARLMRRFWFDRVGGIRLARVQSYDDRGSLITDVSYSDERPLGSGTTASRMPSRVEITRPQDQYKLSITYQDSSSVELNREYGPKAFVLENKWKLPEVDLDAQNKKVTANQ
ncbi:MAG TPA: hypothetical protein VFR78_01625 [Pyrinomonadaceae bacterium]|nr:hypothetical protein [Pyrinomonadaceae bacterium]